MEVNINKLIGLKMPLDAFLIMHCIHNDEKDILQSYVKNVRQIPTEVFLDLIKRGYLINTSKDPNVFTIESIDLTDKYKHEVLKIPNVKGITFEQAFEQLREHYPSKVGDPGGGGVRRLQSDIERCKRLYKTIITSSGQIDEAIHSLILQCIDFEVAERKRSKNIQYMKMLPTYLAQSGWNLVEDDVKALLKKNGTIENTNEGFVEDI